MLSLKRCRVLLGPSCPLEDEELIALRPQLYELAELILHLNEGPGDGPRGAEGSP